MRRNVQQWACLGGPCELMGLQTNPMFQYHNYFLTVVTFYTNCLLTIQKLYVSKLIVFCCLVIHSYPTYLNLVACRDVKTFQMLFSVSQLFPPPSSVSSYCMESANPTKLHFCTQHFSHKGLQKEREAQGTLFFRECLPLCQEKRGKGDETFANSLRFVGPKMLGGMNDQIWTQLVIIVTLHL